MPKLRSRPHLTEAEILERYPDLAPLVASLPPLCTIPEAARALRRSVSTVRLYLTAGKLAGTQGEGGEHILIPRPGIVRLVAARLTAPIAAVAVESDRELLQ